MDFHFLGLRVFSSLALARSTHFAVGKDNTAQMGACIAWVFRAAGSEGLVPAVSLSLSRALSHHNGHLSTCHFFSCFS